MTSTKSTYQDIRLFGISVRGPLHQQQGSQNQDAWAGNICNYVAWTAVCDGLGSRPHSGQGARMACLAVRDAIRYWAKASTASTEHLLRLIRVLWEIKVFPATPSDYATTCLLSAWMPSGRFIVAGLGDGLAVIRFPDGQLRQIIGQRSGFANQTNALGCPHSIGDWSVASFEQCLPGTAILLASDGIAEDLLDEKLGEFVKWLLDEFSAMSPRARHRALRQALHNWPTPRHQDDKTLAILWRNP